jgi:NAD(P) transhydrogenase subunit beta
MNARTVRTLMTHNVVTARPDTGFKDIVDTMATERVSALPVVDADGLVVGIVSEDDLLYKLERPEHGAGARLVSRQRREAQAKAAGDTAADLMTTPAVTIGPEATAGAAARLMHQHEVRELADLLESRGVDVCYAIHPVAGRLPGHMNVLLAEANVPYYQLKEMDEVNPEFARADVALVIGANDVINPAARRPGNPVSGMPILDVDHAHSVIVIKRSMGHGYAGIDNELYSDPKTGMYFADAKRGLAELAAAVKVLVG